MNYKVHLDRKPWFQSASLYVVGTPGGRIGEQFAVHSPIFQSVTPGTQYPSFMQQDAHGFDSDAESFLQAMLDCAWEAGMRPKGFADHTNELKAVRAHLADMRLLAQVPMVVKKEIE